MAKNDFQYGGWNSYILQCGTITTLISSGDCILQCGMRYVALELWQWIHQVAAPCNVIRGSGMTCHWIRPNVRHIGILHLVSISTHPRMSFCTSLAIHWFSNFCEILSKSDHRRQKKMTSCRFSRWRISAILGYRDAIMGSMKSPVKLT